METTNKIITLCALIAVARRGTGYITRGVTFVDGRNKNKFDMQLPTQPMTEPAQKSQKTGLLSFQ